MATVVDRKNSRKSTRVIWLRKLWLNITFRAAYYKWAKNNFKTSLHNLVFNETPPSKYNLSQLTKTPFSIIYLQKVLFFAQNLYTLTGIVLSVVVFGKWSFSFLLHGNAFASSLKYSGQRARYFPGWSWFQITHTERK